VKQSHYRILGLVGEGQFGKVYSAIHRDTGELLALKELDPRRFPTKKFLREIRVLLTLNHPNIVSCQGVEHCSQGRYLVTDYCEGGTLRDLMEFEPELSLEQKLKLFIDILAGLNHAHQNQIIHRDLKPENILLLLDSQGWIAKITDFGVAVIQAEDQDKNSSLGDTGSPAYMAPEQFYGKYSYSSDLYAVSVILYELLLGKRPFYGTPNEIMISHLNKKPEIPDNLSLNLGEIIDKGLQKLPQHRYRSPLEMSQEIEQVLTNLVSRKPQFFVNYNPPDLSWEILATYSLKNPVTHLVVTEDKIYQASSQSISCFTYQKLNNEYSIERVFKSSTQHYIYDLNYGDNLCIFIKLKPSQLEKKYYFYQWNKFEICSEPFFSVEAFDLVYCLDYDNKWLALAKNSESEVGFKLIKLPDRETIIPLKDDLLPRQLITIDKDHGLGIFSQNIGEVFCTVLKIFTRRGTWGDSYCIPIDLSLVTHHKQKSNYLLAVENNPNQENLGVILICIKPFKLTRIPLNFKPNFIVNTPQGFLVANYNGEINILDLEGKNLGQIELKKPLTAIASISEQEIIIGTNSNNEVKLEIVGIRNYYRH
jgi:serine/threonine-protein kinase